MSKAYKNNRFVCILVTLEEFSFTSWIRFYFIGFNKDFSLFLPSSDYSVFNVVFKVHLKRDLSNLFMCSKLIIYFPWLLSRNSKCEELSLFAWMWLSNKQCRTQWANFILKKNCFTFIRLPRTYTCVCTWLTGISKTFNLKELYPHTQCIQCNNLPDRLFLLDKSGSWRWDFKWMAAERPKYTAGNE